MVEVPTRRARLQSSLGLAVALVLWGWFGGTGFVIVVCVAGMLCLLAWLVPRRHAPLQRLLDRLAGALVVGASWVLLGVVYFGVFTPLRFLARLGRRDPLRLRPDGSAASFFEALPPASTRQFTRQF